MRIIFVAHGETLDNAKGILVGQIHGGELSANGRAQAQELSRKLKDTHIDAAYSSDLSRAVQTADEILRHHKGVHLVIAKELRERSYGSAQGKKKAEIGWHDGLVSENREGFEPIKELYLRTKRFLLDVEAQHSKDTVLVVGHRNAEVALEAIVRGIPLGKLGAVTVMKGGEMRIFNSVRKL